MEGGGGTQCPVLHVNDPKKTGARSASKTQDLQDLKISLLLLIIADKLNCECTP